MIPREKVIIIRGVAELLFQSRWNVNSKESALLATRGNDKVPPPLEVVTPVRFSSTTKDVALRLYQLICHVGKSTISPPLVQAPPPWFSPTFHG